MPASNARPPPPVTASAMRAPARASACQRDAAQEYAERIAERLGFIGTLAVEFFVSRGELVVNEMAPRPHNSGHHTIDACVTSQYEQQVRALCGLPLGEARQHSASVMVNLLGELFVNEMAPRPHNSGHHTIDACDVSQYEQQVRALCGLALASPRQHSAAVMVNLLGELWYEDGKGHGPYREPDWSVLHAVPGLRLHLYAKHHARAGRKMGHFTVIGSDADDVLAKALAARAAIGIRGD